MSDERLERLTKLAQKAWPKGRRHVLVSIGSGGCLAHEAPLDELDDEFATLLHCDDVERFESALRVLAGETGKPFRLEEMLSPAVLSDIPTSVRKLIDAALDFEAGCITSMEHNAQRMRHQYAREKARAEAAESRLAELQKRCRELAEQWRAVDYGDCASDHNRGREDMSMDCADELLDALKETP